MLVDRYSQALGDLRENAQLVLSPRIAAWEVRAAARKILGTLELLEIALTDGGGGQADLSHVSNALLLQELSRRVNAVRKVPKLCVTCGQRRVRAISRCHHCYKIAKRKGEI